MHVVATAGHVDHGKSALVHALTGQEPDRLEEETRRGLSIELGYCWTELPGVGEVAFVDVPGHERFITTALAGVGPVPVVLFVVAADDPWMPQAAEHLAALDALDVQRGVLVVTRSDLADPGPMLARAQQELSRTSLARVPAVAVSARSGTGLDDLRAALAAELGSLPPPDSGADVRIWVDRSFHVRGAGTVVTGTLPAGRVRVGDTLELDGHPVRVRGLESIEKTRDEILGVARVAVNLAGPVPDSLGRGSTLLSPAAFAITGVVDAVVSSDDDLPERPVLHVGAAHVEVHSRPLGGRFVRLTSRRALPLRFGDRAVLRDPGSRRIWGVRVLDPMPPPLDRRGAAKRRAETLTAYDGSVDAELAARGVVRRSDLRRLGFADPAWPEGAVVAGDWVVGPARGAALRDELEQLAAGTPAVGPRLTTASAAHQLGLPDVALVAGLVRPPLRLQGGEVVSGPATVPPELLASLDALRADLAQNPFAAPEAGRLQALGLDIATVARLHREGHVVRLADNVVLLPGVEDLAAERLRALPQPFTTSQARQAWGTTRRVALPLLARLDRRGRTLRLPDDTRRLRDRPGPADAG